MILLFKKGKSQEDVFNNFPSIFFQALFSFVYEANISNEFQFFCCNESQALSLFRAVEGVRETVEAFRSNQSQKKKNNPSRRNLRKPTGLSTNDTDLRISYSTRKSLSSLNSCLSAQPLLGGVTGLVALRALRSGGSSD